MESVTQTLSRGDWIGICITLLVVAGVIVAALWKAHTNEKVRADTTQNIIKINADCMKELCTEIRNATQLSQQANQKVLEALLEAIRIKNR